MTQKHSHHGVVKHPLHLHSKKKHKKKVKHLSVVPMMFRETESQSVRRKPRATHRLLKFKSDSPDGRVHVWGQEETIMVREDEQHPGRFMAAPPELHDDEDELSKLEDEVDDSSDSESDPSASVNGDTPQSSEDKEADEVAEAAEETEPCGLRGVGGRSGVWRLSGEHLPRRHAFRSLREVSRGEEREDRQCSRRYPGKAVVIA